mmetsp:Transcript_87647/g.165245  ORF Transcript_87647/g.165245 Transcript_87647/m.165245 type:complete len:248 (+) Transcript_87647:712-1455(+)
MQLLFAVWAALLIGNADAQLRVIALLFLTLLSTTRLLWRVHPDDGVQEQRHGRRPIVHVHEEALLNKILHGVREAIPINDRQLAVCKHLRNLGILIIERKSFSHHEIDRETKRPDVNTLIPEKSKPELGCAIRGCAAVREHQAAVRALPDALGAVEICDFYHCRTSRQHHVCWLQIPVHYALVMKVIDATQQLGAQLLHSSFIECLTAFQIRVYRTITAELHAYPDLAAAFITSLKLDDRRVAQRLY